MTVTDVLMLAAAMLFPPAGLLFLLWLARIEETLPRDVRTTQRRPAPPPVLAVPVRRRAVESPVAPAVPVPAEISVAVEVPVARPDVAIPAQRSPLPDIAAAEAV